VPESWIPSTHLQELRSRVRLRHTLSDERCDWQQRIQAQLCHHGVPRRRRLLVGDGRAWLEALGLPDAARRQIEVALALIDAVDAQLRPLGRELRALARRQPGCRALMSHHGIGEITSLAILAELGDARRFSSSRHAVRHAGMDITVFESDHKRARPRTEIRLRARAQRSNRLPYAHAPPGNPQLKLSTPDAALAAESLDR
jgi:transposase